MEFVMFMTVLSGFFLFLLASGSEARVKKDWVLTLPAYTNLPQNQKLQYSRRLRDELLTFEKAQARENKGFVFNGFGILDEAYAAETGTCVVGGVMRSRIKGKCPTFGRGCGGKSDGFLCGRVYAGACVDRLPLSGLSQRCHSEAKNEISSEDYGRVKQTLESGLTRACTKKSPSCDLLKARLTEMNAKFDPGNQVVVVPPPPEPGPQPTPRPSPPPNVDPVPGPDNFSVVKEGESCLSDRDQGQNGSCHAFCLTCVYDQAVREKKPEFRASANWIAMLSVVDRMCDVADYQHQPADKILSAGWHPHKNMELLAAVGACDQKNFLPYSHTEGWERQFNISTRGLNSRPQTDDASWSRQFGIDGKAAYDLFCPTENQSIASTIDGYEKRLGELEAKNGNGQYSNFLKCAKEGLENAKSIKPSGSQTCDYNPLPSNSESKLPTDRLKEALRRSGRPIPIVIQTDVSGHSFHCVTVTGFDDKAGKFNTINSWGSSQQYKEIPYSAANGRNANGAAIAFYNTDCVAAPAGTPTATGQGRGSSRSGATR
jgi:hypothetical protein